MASHVFGMVLLSIGGLFILYVVIFKAVKEGINKSVVGQSIEKILVLKDIKKSLRDDDFDH